MADSLEYILSCQICLEDFDESGDHVPRLLPCTHTLCERCLKQLIQGHFLECPECRKKHRVVNEVRTFPQNKYILFNIRRKQAEIMKNEQMPNICGQHGKELNLYCKGPECQTKICQRCLTRNHRGEGHDVVETEEIEKEALLEKIEVVVKGLEEGKENILKVKKEAESENIECVENIKARKEKLIQMINQRFEQMLAEVIEKGQNDVTEKLTIIEEHSDLLKNIKDNVDKDVITHQEIEADMETVISVEQSMKEHLSGKVVYKVFKLENMETFSADVDRLCGRLEESVKYLRLTDLEKNVLDSCEVVNSLHIGNTDVRSLAPIDGTCIAILDGRGRKLLKYRSCSGEKIQEIQLNGGAKSIVEIQLAGRKCLAVSYEEQQRIEFRDVKDLNTIVLDHSVRPHHPWEMCASSNSSLCYVSYSQGSNSHQLDCSSFPCLSSVAISHHDIVDDVCCAELKGTSLLIAACRDSGLEAYNISTKKLVWCIKGKIPGNKNKLCAFRITTDEKGRLFVRDIGNRCIHIFSVDGKYVTTLLKEGEQGLGKLAEIRWSECLSGLIVVHYKGNNTSISLIKIQS